MSDVSIYINPMKKIDPHVLTFAPLRVVLKPCDHLATPAGFCFTPETTHNFEL